MNDTNMLNTQFLKSTPSITPVTTNFIPDSDLSLQKTGCNSRVKNTIPEKIANTNTKL